MTSFTSLGVPARLASVLTTRGFETPTPIQRSTLPDAFAGRDILGRGRTGSGKTLAFLLPLVARLSGGPRAKSGTPRALILAPTRELVTQIDAALQPLAEAAGLTSHTVFGGVRQHSQVAALRRGVDIVIACPGRLEDLMKQRHCSLARVELTVLDEADHMADLGFLPGVKRILAATPSHGQRLLFSATLDRATDALVRQFLTRPAVHEADSAQSPVSTMSHHVLQLARADRLPVLIDLTSAPGRTVVFTRTKHGAKALARQLSGSGVSAVELHGNLNQNARTRNLDAFHAGRVSTLVATDIAARGIHVDDVALVIHADPPVDPKAYLHRSGRTARAGNSGAVVTLAMPEQAREVNQLTRAAGVSPRIVKINSTQDPVLTELAPGPRTRQDPIVTAPKSQSTSPRQQAAGRAAGRTASSNRAGTDGPSRRRSNNRGRGSSAAAAGGASPAGAKGKAPAQPPRRSKSSSRRIRSANQPATGAVTHSVAGFSARQR